MPVSEMEGTMFASHSYQEVLSERICDHNVVMSAWFVVMATAVFLLASA
jgi:hypothetical protein